MNSFSRTLRKISTQLRTNLTRKRSTSSSGAYKKSVRFYAVDTVYYTHSSLDYDRTPSDEEDF